MDIFEKSYRHEVKYLISENTANLLKYKLSLIMKKDEHYDDYYNIRSLYFDDIYNTFYHEKIDGIIDRKKYRIRIYNLDDTFISVEIKGKNNDLSFKDRDIITKEEYDYLINKEYDKININNRKILKDLIKNMKYKNIIPKVVVDYRRLAFVYDIDDTRITFDENIKSGKFNYDLFDKDMFLYDILNENEILLEVKYNETLPYVLKEILSKSSTIYTSLSKYALCMEKKGIDL